MRETVFPAAASSELIERRIRIERQQKQSISGFSRSPSSFSRSNGQAAAAEAVELQQEQLNSGLSRSSSGEEFESSAVEVIDQRLQQKLVELHGTITHAREPLPLSSTFGFVLEYGMKLNSWFHGDTRRSRQ